MLTWLRSRKFLLTLLLVALVGCGKSCSLNCNPSVSGGDAAPFMLLEFCLNADPNIVGVNQFPVTAAFTGTLQGVPMPAPTFNQTANGVITPTPNTPQCVSTNVYNQKPGTWSVTAVITGPARSPVGPCTGTNPGTIVLDISSGQLQCKNTAF